MICVSIARGRHRHVLAEHRHLVQQGAKLVELRLDYIGGEINLKRLITDRPSAVVITCRRERDGGKFSGSEETRLMLLRQAIAEGVEYVDLEDDIAGSIPRFGKTKRIVSLHDFRKTPDNLDAVHKQLAAHDADIVKIATMANQPHDNVRMLKLIRNSKVPTVGMCMGDIGTPSRLLAGRFGAPFTYATFHHERTLAPGQLSFTQMSENYHYDQIEANTAVYGVIGDPIGHSLSPIVHNAALRQLHIDGVYIPFRVPREHLQQFIEDAPAMGVRGLSVTIPHKELVLKHLAKTDETTRGVGAANTLVFGPDGIAGYNTDHQAAMDSLEQALTDAAGSPPVAPGREMDLSSRRALVLGAGGAAKAIAYGLKRRGADVVIAGRTAQRAQQLAGRLQCRVVDWSARYSIDPDLLINCTPVGMHPNVDATPFEKHHLKPSMVVFDTVYNPENTLLIKDARSQSCTVINGVEMFIRQASLQFALFTGVEAPSDRMREVLKREIGPAKY
jgi:3-dehydroquinate dehydratase/shikimate dehydrogenase